MTVRTFALVAALALPLTVSAQAAPASPEPGTPPVTSQTPAAQNGPITTTGTTTTDSAAAPMTKDQQKAQRKEQKRQEKAAKANAKAAKDNAKAVKDQDKATNAAEKAQPHQ